MGARRKDRNYVTLPKGGGATSPPYRANRCYLSGNAAFAVTFYTTKAGFVREYTDEEDAVRLWKEGFQLLMKEQKYTEALRHFHYLLDNFNLRNTPKGIVLTGVAEAEFALGHQERGKQTNLQSLKYIPGHRDTYRRTIYMAKKSRRYFYIPYINFLYVKNFRKVMAQMHHKISNDLDPLAF